MPKSTVHVYDCGHLDPYVEQLFDQLNFLCEQVPVRG